MPYKLVQNVQIIYSCLITIAFNNVLKDQVSKILPIKYVIYVQLPIVLHVQMKTSVNVQNVSKAKISNSYQILNNALLLAHLAKESQMPQTIFVAYVQHLTAINARV